VRAGFRETLFDDFAEQWVQQRRKLRGVYFRAQARHPLQ
jgi:hypothetical protein